MSQSTSFAPDPALAGLDSIQISTSECSAKLARFGGCLLSFRPDDQEDLLFTSEHAVFDGRKAIRGGIPICFPWFNAHPTDPTLPSHGYARIQNWDEVSEETSTETVTLQTRIEGFQLTSRFTFGHELTLSLEVTNLSDAVAPCELMQHSYFRSGDIRQTRVHGLEGARMIDQLDGNRESTHPRAPITFDSEYDRIFLDTADHLKIEDPVLQRMIHLRKSGARSAVVWNPWIEKAARTSDLGDEEWRDFVCVETGNVGENQLDLAPGEIHRQTLRVGLE